MNNIKLEDDSMSKYSGSQNDAKIIIDSPKEMKKAASFAQTITPKQKNIIEIENGRTIEIENGRSRNNSLKTIRK